MRDAALPDVLIDVAACERRDDFSRRCSGKLAAHRPIWISALRIGSSETRRTREPGLSNSRIIMMPPETAIEQSIKAAMAVPFLGANSPKDAKTSASQNISRTRNGTGMLLLCC